MAELLLPHWHPLGRRLAEPALAVPRRKPVGSVVLSGKAPPLEFFYLFGPGKSYVTGDTIGVRYFSGSGIWSNSPTLTTVDTTTPSFSTHPLGIYFDSPNAVSGVNNNCNLIFKTDTVFPNTYGYCGAVLDVYRWPNGRSLIPIAGGSYNYVSIAGGGTVVSFMFGNRETEITGISLPTGRVCLTALWDQRGSVRDVYLFCNGRLIAESLGGTKDISPASQTGAGIYLSTQVRSDGTFGFHGVLHALWLGTNPLPTESLRAWSADPYKVLRPANSSPYLLSIPGGATTLPTLSAPTLVSAGGNNYYPRVTATYS